MRCGRAAASGVSAPDKGSTECVGWVLPAAGLAHFFARTLWVGKARAGLKERMERNGAIERLGAFVWGAEA